MNPDGGNNPQTLARIELALAQQARALIELEQQVRQHTMSLADHGRTLDRIERRGRVESGALDDHEKRLAALEASLRE
jgi:hypothetical protein